MSDVEVYNKADVIRLMSKALHVFLGEKIDRISFEIGKYDEIVLVINKKKWSIQIGDYEEKDDD